MFRNMVVNPDRLKELNYDYQLMQSVLLQHESMRGVSASSLAAKSRQITNLHASDRHTGSGPYAPASTGKKERLPHRDPASRHRDPYRTHASAHAPTVAIVTAAPPQEFEQSVPTTTAIGPGDNVFPSWRKRQPPATFYQRACDHEGSPMKRKSPDFRSKPPSTPPRNDAADEALEFGGDDVPCERLVHGVWLQTFFEKSNGAAVHRASDGSSTISDADTEYLLSAKLKNVDLGHHSPVIRSSTSPQRGRPAMEGTPDSSFH